ncbi:pectinesterase-like [Dorcoceras hygrometricum]|uniref:Pectinesterase n=1 Tax=Dorcoceras hygrometricum TaxID=472368 RepID=A0A2Z7C3I2_9LAMI|nr:pectinesterase-like [Dorcoceras hygrometricum]
MISRRLAIIGICATLMVLGTVAAAVILIKKNAENSSSRDNDDYINASQKAIQGLCQRTYYYETCVTNLSNATESFDPMELIKVGFQAAIQELTHAIDETEALHKISQDPNTAESYRTCRKLLDDSIDDLQKTFDRIDSFDPNGFKIFVDDIKTWLTGALTFQETCLDCFEDDKGDNATKMRQLLRVARELAINGLALMEDFTNLILSNEPGTFRRRLLSNKKISANSINEDGESLFHGSIRIHENFKPDVVVAKDGTGKYTTIDEALRDVPQRRRSNEAFVIHIKEGVYQENIVVSKNMRHVVFIGDGPTKTKITGSRSKDGGTETYWTATVAIDGDNFLARDIGFENTAGPEMHQAVALRVTGDHSMFYNCQMDGYQDTLLAHNHRQFYRDCTISGTVDFIFGNAKAVFQNCSLLVRKPMINQNCIVTAQGRSTNNESSAFVLQNCRIMPAPEYLMHDATYRTFLGRPWKAFSKTIVMDSELDSVVDPQGWASWNETSAHLYTCFYAEVDNHGRGADKRHRVTWPGIKKISIREAARYTPGDFLLADNWIADKGIPFSSGLIYQNTHVDYSS